MPAKIPSGTIIGVQGVEICVEVEIFSGLRKFIIVGLPDSAVREAKERVRCALENSGYQFPRQEVVVNLAPASLPKTGAHFDLAIALGLLELQTYIAQASCANTLVTGELNLDGSITCCGGELGLVLLAKKLGLKRVIIPHQVASLARYVQGIEIISVETLNEAVQVLRGKIKPRTLPKNNFKAASNNYNARLDAIIGHSAAKRALQVAAAGGHNINLVGPPGSGKTMLARSLPELLPPLTLEQALEVENIYSCVTGKSHLDKSRFLAPFRAPHHGTSSPALIGGGSPPRAGEITLAHHGVLFLDELLEFRRDTLEALREPLESGWLHLRRVAVDATFPARFMLVTALNPCQCGNFGRDDVHCTCNPQAVYRYQRKLSGPLIDRIDLHIWVPSISMNEFQTVANQNSASTLRAQVIQARSCQEKRLGQSRKNSLMTTAEIKQYCVLETTERLTLEKAVDKFHMSTRVVTRTLSVARTIADLEDSPTINAAHLLEALRYRRALDRIKAPQV